MAREIIVRTWCDACLDDDRHNEGEEIPALTFPGLKQSRVVALCEVHRKELYDPLRELLVKHGQVADETASSRLTSGRYLCPERGCSAVCKDEATLIKHRAQKHPDAPSTPVQQEALVEVPARSTTAPKGDFPCPACGQMFDTSQGKGMHLRRTKDAQHAKYRAQHGLTALVAPNERT